MRTLSKRRSGVSTLMQVLAVLVFPLGLLIWVTIQATVTANERAEIASDAEETLEFLVSAVRLQAALADESLLSELRAQDISTETGLLAQSPLLGADGDDLMRPEARTDALLEAIEPDRRPFEATDVIRARQTVQVDRELSPFSRGFDQLEVPLALEISESLDEARRAASQLNDTQLVDALELLELRVDAYLSSNQLMGDLAAFWFADGVQEAVFRGGVTGSQTRLQTALEKVAEDARFTGVNPLLEARGFDRRVQDVVIGGSSPFRNQNGEMLESNAEVVISSDLTEGFERIYSLAELSVDTASTVNDLFGERLQSTQRSRAINLVLTGFAILASLATALWFARSTFVAADRRDQLEGQLFKQATVDHLTGLPNRRSAIQKLDQLVRTPEHGQEYPAVIFVDLDRFKRVNDVLGHSMGDQLLVEVANRLCASARPQHMAARLGGDEFIVVVEAGSDVDEITTAAKELVEALSAPYRIGEHDLDIGASAGVALGAEGQSVAKLLHQADVALYAAKTSGLDANVTVYTGEFQASVEAAERIEQDLSASLDSDTGLHLAYQPILHATGSIGGLEALLRWEQEGFGTVPPSVFIPVAEKSSLVSRIDRWVVLHALADLRTLRDATGNPNLTVSVNFSGRHVVEHGFVDHIKAALEAAGLSPTALVVEVTETVLIFDVPAAASNLAELRALGCRVSIDDFGTGYTSINQLLNFPADELKLDRSLVDDSQGLNHMASLVVQMANSLDLKTVAEGIETEESAATMRAIGCDYLQGYHLARPMSFEALLGWCASHPSIDVDHPHANNAAAA